MEHSEERSHRGGRRHALLAVTLLVLALAGTFTFARLLQHDDKVAAQAAGEDDDIVIIRRSSITPPAYSLDELVERADLVVSSTALSQHDSVLIEPVDGEEARFFTDVEFRVDHVYNDKLDAVTDSAGSIVVRNEGGNGEHVGMVVEGVPEFEQGAGYLLFLYRLFDGTHYNAAGDHWYVVGAASGAWSADDDGTFCCPYELPEGGSFADAAELESVVERLRDSGRLAPNPDRRDGASANLDEIERAHREGRIPDGVYRERLELAELEGTEFAHVMTPEEQEAYELGALGSAGTLAGSASSSS